MTDPRPGFDLSGRVAAVTGAASGIGRASAEMLAAAGATVACCDVDLEGAKETVRRIEAAGGVGEASLVDVADREQVDAFVAGIVEGHGRLDVMANVAGIIVNNLVVDTTEEELDRVLGVNLKGVFFGCQAAARVMTAQGSGSIVNMASAAIDAPREGLISYALAKAGVAQLTKTLAMEVGPSGVRVNAVAPGFVITGMTGRHFTADDGTIDEAVKEATVAPMRDRSALRAIGDPDDIAYAVLYLASDAARFMTGQAINVTGGVYMG